MLQGIVAFVAALLFAGPAWGAGVDLTGGRNLKLLDRADTDKDMAKVKFAKDAAIADPLPDPTTDASRVRISSEDGNTGWLDLDIGLWEPAGTTGYKYKDKTGAVQKVVLKTKNGLGKIIIKLKGDEYGLVALTGPEDYVEVRLDIGTTTYCGRFEPPTSEEKTNEEGKVILKGPSVACQSTCPAGGEKVGGSCWYLGDPNSDCDTTCVSAGGVYDPVTSTYAGDLGSDANCEAVLDALAVPPDTLEVDGPGGTGCMYCPACEETVRWRDPNSTVAAARHEDVRRACACQESP